ncbi:MAG: TonB-dependent receptor [Acidobacteriia bacterium]|nr:TonB-dependent receptor [Terriglobia bacterium]
MRPIALHCAFAAILCVALVTSGLAQELSGKVIDENGLAVAGAKVSLNGGGLKAPLAAVSDDAGRFQLPAVEPGTYELKAEKPGYYATISRALQIKERATSLEVVLNHQQEFEETVNVVYSAPVVDRQEASKATTITAEEIVDLPTIATHDFHNSLPLIPGIVKDNNGRMHMNGGRENQAFYSLDGFNITSPVSGILENRISVDAIRALRIETSRYSAEYGKGSAGVMALESSQGDDHFRLSSTNFLPSFSVNDGLKLSNWNPRATISGPIVKGRAWYYNALDLQYDLNVIKELPPGGNTNHSWQGSNLTRIQVNLAGKNILTGGLLFDFRDSPHFGLSPLDPVETTRGLSEHFYFLNLKDQAYFSGGWVLETGVAMNQINTRQQPLGRLPYVLSPQGRSGNYYLQSEGKVGRTQALASVMAPLWDWHGRHSFKFGIDANRISYRQFSDRRPFEIAGSTGTVSRQVSFQGNPRFGRNSSEFSGYFQDSWMLNDQVFVEAGIRFDWDQVLRQRLWSPRLAFTWGPARFPDSKFSAGIGVFHDATNLAILAQALDQERSDIFFDQSGAPVPGGPLVTRFMVDERGLRAPFYLNWSAGWQQKLGRGFYLDTNFIRKNGRHGWAYDLGPSIPSLPTQYVYYLGSARRDSYSYVEIELSRTFKGKYPWLLSYARASTRTTQVINFSQDNPIFARQAGGPLDWDTPNRLISWSVIPLPHFKKYSLAYFAEWHTGMPWSRVNQFQQLVGEPNSRRFPNYFSLNLHLERRVRIWRSEWALRAGFNNITGHLNPTVVNNNIDAMDFGRFSGSEGRVFTGRIRFLGKN